VGLTLLLPLGLTALAALLIPLLLHLHRRQEQQATLFAALRWIRGPARPRRQVLLEQWPLLLLRLLLLVVLAVLLAQPQWRGEAVKRGDWVVVAPGVEAAQARAQLDLPHAQWRWLLPDFPPLDNAAHGASEALVSASLLREIDSELAPDARLHVVVPGTLQGLDGAAISLSRRVDWQVIAQAPSGPRTAPAPKLRVSLRADAPAPARAYLQAAVRAWNEVEPERFTLAEEAPGATLDANTALVLWLSGEPPPALQRWVEAGGTALVSSALPGSAGLAVQRPDSAPPAPGAGQSPPPAASSASTPQVIARSADGAPLMLAQTLGRGRLLGFTHALDPAQLPLLLDASFPQVLRDALVPPQAAPDWASAAAMQPGDDAARSSSAAQSLASPLILLAALAFLAERALSFFYRRRRP
jgi:hypothetical protein